MNHFRAMAALMLAATSEVVLATTAYPNTSTFGVSFSKDEEWYRQCMRVEHVIAPVHKLQGPGKAECGASDLYYDARSQATASSADWTEVHQCAVAEGDNAVLAMLYANGFGVKRNTDIAIHYACLVGSAKAEMEGRVEHLAKLRTGEIFDQCDDITSGYMGNLCASIQESLDSSARERRLDRLEQSLPASARPLFKKLRVAAGSYAEAATSEIDMSGTGAVGFSIERGAKLRSEFVRTVEDVLANKVPLRIRAEVVQLDKELNAAYRDIMKGSGAKAGEADRLGDSTIERNDVRQAQRQWLAYRDAFIAFRSKIRSGPDQDTIVALLLKQRVAELQELASNL